jgi:uncharacterized protein involved in outer membrane biogenesis
MTDTTVGSPAPRKPRRWLRVLGIVVAVLVVLLVVVYFVATSSGFLKGVILPKVSKAMNAQVTVSDASISPFSQVVLHNLKVQTTGAEPLVTAAEVRLRYSLMDIIGGNMHVDEMTLASPTVTLIENPDGSTSLDPILKAQTKAPEKQPAPAKPAKPLQVDVKKVALTDATVRHVKNYANGKSETEELSHVNVTLDDLKNGQTGKLALSADISVTKTNGAMTAKLTGNFTFALAPDLKPGAVQGTTHFEVTHAEGALAEVATLGTDLHVDVTPTEVKGVELSFQKGTASLGQLTVSGPFDMEKLEGRLNINLASIDKRLLNLAGAAQGLDFGPTTISSTNQVELAKGGAVINARGRLDVNQFQVTRTNQTTPRLDLRDQYDVTVDRGQSVATLRTLTITGTQNGNQLLKGELTSPMQIAWGNTNNALGDSALTLTLSGLNLADWKPFIGDAASAGTVSATTKVLSQQGGRQVTFDFDSHIDGLSVKAGTNQLADLAVVMSASGKAADLKQYNLTASKLTLTRLGKTLFNAAASGTYDQAAQTADLQASAQAALDHLLEALPAPDTAVSSGTVDLKAHVTQKQKTQAVTGTLVLADLTGRFGKNETHSLGTTVDFDVAMTPEQVQLRKATGKLTQAGKPGGSFELSAAYDMSKKSATLDAKLTRFNQDGIGPFLEPMLAGKKLVSVAINANAGVQYAPQGPISVKADFAMNNLVVSNVPEQMASAPLEAKMQVDASTHDQVVDVRQFQLTLTPTDRAANQVNLTGQVDMTHTNAITGNLKLTADSLDFTRYYDLVTAPSKPPSKEQGKAAPEAGKAESKAAKEVGKAEPQKEPAPVTLPLHDFTASASIGRLYLREVAITNWQTTIKLDGSQVVVDPFKLTLNGAPVDATVKLDMSKPGYQYDVSWNGQAIPLTPLVNSFQPDSKGQLGGTATLTGKINGAGITGPNLQKNLAGQMDLSTTNLNLNVVNIKSQWLKSIVNVVASIPEFLGNPVGTATSFVGGLLGGKTSQGGLMSDLQQSPIDTVSAAVKIGSGVVNLTQSMVRSPAFQAEASGTVTLDPVLTNSVVQIPVKISLSQPIAKKLNLTQTTATNAVYYALPDFVTLRGTVGQIKPDINKGALGGLALKTVTGAIPSAGQSTLGTVGNLLGIKSSGQTNQPAATNQSPVKSLLKGFLGR